MIKEREFFTCGRVLWIFLFTGCIINYLLKISFNLVIVEMVITKEQKNLFNEFFINNNLNSTNRINLNETLPTTLEAMYPNKFNWSEYQQGLALGSFYWSYWITQVPGGLLSQHYGTKLIFGGGNFLAAIVGLILPAAIKYNFHSFLMLRVVQGAIMGTVTPSMHVLTAKWIPPNKRGKFNSCYMGGSIGTAFSYILSSAIIYYYSWEITFYVMSIICIIWYGFWLYFVYDTPQKHPRITSTELKKIIKELSTNGTDNNDKIEKSIPWIDIIKSGPFWATVTAHWASTWGFYTLLVQGPTYFKAIHKFSTAATSIITGCPHLLLMTFSCCFGALCDILLKKNIMSRTNVRKLAVSMCTIFQAIFTIGLSLSGQYSTLACLLFIIATMMSGALSAASVTVFVDLSPNFGSLLFGIAGLFANIASAVSPVIVGLLTNNNQTLEQWRLVFILAAANLLVGGLIFVIWGSAKEQPWNKNNQYNDTQDGQELQNLTKTIINEKQVETFSKY